MPKTSKPAGPEADPLASDPALLASFRAGEHAALTRVFRLYAPRVASLVRSGITVRVQGAPVRVGLNPADDEVEAVVQEVFLRAFKASAREAYDGQRRYSSYLFAITRNLLIDEARRPASKILRLPADISEVEVEDKKQRSPEDEAAAHQLREQLAEAVERLPEPDRSIFKLRFLEHATLKETAQRLSVPFIRVRRVEAKLRQHVLQLMIQHGHINAERARLLEQKLVKNS